MPKGGQTNSHKGTGEERGPNSGRRSEGIPVSSHSGVICLPDHDLRGSNLEVGPRSAKPIGFYSAEAMLSWTGSNNTLK